MQGEGGQTYYTRNGNFGFALGNGGGLVLANTDGLPVLDSTGKPIVLGTEFVASKISVTADGQLCYPDETNNPQPIGITIGVYQFSNPSGLEKQGDTLFGVTAASGAALNEVTNLNLDKSRVVQGYLEGSSVQVADEMVNMIVAQRAYELNSKAITTSDEMMQIANNLKR